MSQNPAREVPRHLLAVDDTMPFASWTEWKKTFSQVNILEAREGLLHFGFQVPTPNVGERRDRILFYSDLSLFAYASGLYGDSNPFGENGSVDVDAFGQKRGALSDARQRVARKACEVFCQQFLKKKTDKDLVYDRSVAMAVREILSDEEMLSNILKFLEIGWDGPRPFLVNFGYMTPKHVLEIISFFVETFWNTSFCPQMLAENPKWFHDDEKLLGVKAASLRSTLVTILAALNKLPLIIDRCTELDAPTLSTIEAAALRGKRGPSHPYGWTTFASFEEAAGAGSRIARAMIIINVLRNEHKRNEEIKKAEEQRAQSERRIAVLRGQSS